MIPTHPLVKHGLAERVGLVHGRVQVEDPSGLEPLLEGGDGLQGIVEDDLRIDINRGKFKRAEHLVHDDSRFNDLAKVGVLVVLVGNQHLGDSGRRVHAQLRHGPKNSVRVELVVLEDDDVPQALIEKTSST